MSPPSPGEPHHGSDDMETLNLAQAARFLNMHPVTVQAKARAARFPRPSQASAGHLLKMTLCPTCVRTILPNGERWKVTRRRNHYVTLQA